MAVCSEFSGFCVRGKRLMIVELAASTATATATVVPVNGGESLNVKGPVVGLVLGAVGMALF